MDDDVTDQVKARRLQEIVDLQQNMLGHSEEFIGQTVEVLVEKSLKNQLKNSRQKLAKYHRSFPKRIIKLVTLSMSKLQAAQVVPKRRINWFKRDELENLNTNPLINTK
jgi:tRNA A37 methylthiotransferase MiaB